MYAYVLAVADVCVCVCVWVCVWVGGGWACGCSGLLVVVDLVAGLLWDRAPLPC